MKKFGYAIVILVIIPLAACSSSTPSPTPVSPTAVPRKSGTIRVSIGGSVNVKDVPSQMAFDAMREQGYTVEVIPFAKTSLIPVALDKGDIEVSDATTSLVWAAAAQGADIRTVVAKVGTSFILASTKGISNCRDLDGKAITFSTRQSVGYVMFEKHVAENCPGIKPDVILISETSNRMAALQAGDVVAAYLDLGDWLQLQQSAPDRFHVLIDFALEFPRVCFLTFSVRREWAAQNQSMLKDFIQALVATHRSIIENPQRLSDAIVKYLSIEPAQAQQLADACLAAGLWDPNGGLTAEDITYTLQFFRDGGILTTDSKVEDVADLSHLNAVLAEMGRR